MSGRELEVGLKLASDRKEVLIKKTIRFLVVLYTEASLYMSVRIDEEGIQS